MNSSLLDCPILVVDDTEFNRVIIGAMLEEAGYRKVAFACGGAEALAAIAAAPPDLVLLDIMMPGMDGFEVCTRIRQSYQNADLPVLVQTALSSMEDRNRAFEVGATDLVSKPIERYELLARVRNHLENRVLIRRHRAYRERVEGELAIAKGMYEHLIPTRLQCEWIRQNTGVTVRAHSRLSSELGGSIWGVTPLSGNRVGVFMADMSGRGLAAALNAFRLHTLMLELKDLGEMPAAFLTALNARASSLLEPGDCGRVLFGVSDPSDDVFTYAAAGDILPRLARAGGGELLRGEPGGEEIGVSPDAVYRSRSISFKSGDVLVLENRPLPMMTMEDGGAADPTAVAATAAAGDGGDVAFAWLAEGVDELAPADCDDDYLAVWLDRSALDVDLGEV
jgi:phosphoserine phosphatase RsbU/P